LFGREAKIFYKPNFTYLFTKRISIYLQ